MDLRNFNLDENLDKFELRQTCIWHRGRFRIWILTKSKDGKANVGDVHIQSLIYLNGPDLDSSLMELT